MRKLSVVVLCIAILAACNKERTGSELESVSKDTPFITSVSAGLGVFGDTLTISGQSFAKNAAVLFGANGAKVIETGDTYVKVMVPQGSGSVYIKVWNGGYSSNSVAFTYKTIDQGAGGLGQIINIQGSYYLLDTAALFDVGPGTRYMQLVLNDTGFAYAPVRINMLVYDVSNPYLTFKPVLANDKIPTTETVLSMASRKSAPGNVYFAGTSADFFRTTTDNFYGQPVQGLVIDGDLVTSPSYLTASDVNTGGVDAHAFFENGKKLFIDYAVYNGSASSKTQYMSIDGVNKIRLGTLSEARMYIMLMTKYTGASTLQSNAGAEASLLPVTGFSFPFGFNKTTSFVVNGSVVAKQTGMAIPANGAVLSGYPGQAISGTTPITTVTKLANGDTVKVNIQVYPQSTPSRGFSQMIGGRSWIIRNGILNDTNWLSKLQRTAIGVSQDESKVYMCTVDNPGLFTKEVAQLMQLYGVYNALNLIGGNETTLFVKNAGYNNTGLMNRPNNGTTSYVNGEGIFGVSSAPEDNTVTAFSPANNLVRLAAGNTFTPVFYGMNQYGLIVNTALVPATVALDNNAIGSFSNGTFTATAKGTGKITATYGGVTKSIKIIVQ